MRCSRAILTGMTVRIALWAALVVPQLAFADATPQVVTSASGEVRLRPDRARILIGVQTRAPTAAAAARDNNARQQAVIAAIAATGVAKDDIATESYDVATDMRSDKPGQPPVVLGYVVTNVVRVEVRRTDQVAPIIDAALAKGANQINALEFYSSNADAARRQALTEAVGKARGDAEAMARAAGGRLGPVIELSTADLGPRPMYRAAGYSAAASAPIEPGELTVKVAVTGRWQFLQSP